MDQWDQYLINLPHNISRNIALNVSATKKSTLWHIKVNVTRHVGRRDWRHFRYQKSVFLENVSGKLKFPGIRLPGKLEFFPGNNNKILHTIYLYTSFIEIDDWEHNVVKRTHLYMYHLYPFAWHCHSYSQFPL